MSSEHQIGRPRVFQLQNYGHITTENDFPAVLVKFWYMYKLTYRKFEKRWADVFQIYPNAIHFNPRQFCPSMSLLGFPVFCSSSSIVLDRYFDILVNSMTILSVLKLPKIAWQSPFTFPSTHLYTWVQRGTECLPRTHHNVTNPNRLIQSPARQP